MAVTKLVWYDTAKVNGTTKTASPVGMMLICLKKAVLKQRQRVSC